MLEALNFGQKPIYLKFLKLLHKEIMAPLCRALREDKKMAMLFTHIT